MVTAKELAETYALGGRTNYEQYHNVQPVIWVLDEKGFGLAGMITDKYGEPREHFMMVAAMAMAAWEVETRFVAIVVEAWTKAYPDSKSWEELNRTIERGQLARESETDPEVRTAIFTLALDFVDIAQSCAVYSRVDGDDPLVIEWDIFVSEGEPPGELPKALLAAHAAAQHARNHPENPLGKVDVDRVCRMLVEIDACYTALAIVEAEG